MTRGVSNEASPGEPALPPGRAPGFGPQSRLLVVAPHPDDETIAAGGLLLRAQAAGAGIRVWLLTDGDNNPWPQRWLERRWRIDAADRLRWGARRRAESAAALRQLGIDAGVLEAYGWPDGGLTEVFLRDPAGITRKIADKLRDFAPTHVALPSATDDHPDHGAAALLLTLALRQSGLQPRTLAYQVHGRRPSERAATSDLEPGEWQRKQHAVAEYATQAALTGPRLRRMAGRREGFRPEAFPAGAAGSRLAVRLESGAGASALVCDLPWPHPPLTRQRLLVVAAREGVPDVRVLAGPALAALARRRGAGTRLTVPLVNGGACETFLKLEPLRRGLWIFDRYPWVRPLAPPRTAGGTGPAQAQRRTP